MLATPEAMDALRKVITNSREIYGCIGHALVAAPDVAGWACRICNVPTATLVQPPFGRLCERKKHGHSNC